jgi:hypothetical protein
LADKATQLVLDALSRAAADPGGVPLLAAKAAPGLFTATALGKQAAQRCKDEGYLRVLRTEMRGKAVHEVCALSEKGLAFLLSQVSPKQVLEDLVRALESRRGQFGELVEAARQAQASLDALRATAQKVLEAVTSGKPLSGNGSPSANGAHANGDVLLSYLARWQAAGNLEDCSLPELYRHTREAAPALTIGAFHDGLRRLHERQQVYLHPWTGPLYDLPEPAYALLIGHEVAYYASVK